MTWRERITRLTDSQLEGASHLLDQLKLEHANGRGRAIVDNDKILDALLDRDLSRLTPSRMKRRATREDAVGARAYELSLDDQSISHAECRRIAKREFKLADAERDARKGTKPKKKSRRA